MPASSFLVRIAGVPLDELSKLSTPRTFALARDLAVLERTLDEEATRALDAMRSLDADEGPDDIRQAVFRALIARRPLDPQSSVRYSAVVPYTKALARVEVVRSQLEEAMDEEMRAVRGVLLDGCRKWLERYTVFASKEVADFVASVLEYPDDFLVPRGNRKARLRARSRAETLLLYLQRVSAKNDSFSDFGPVTWGHVAGDDVEVRSDGRIRRRNVFVETWVVRHLAEAISDDEEARIELCPRIHPDVRLEGHDAWQTGTGERIPLEDHEVALLRQCDGNTPARLLGATATELLSLVDRGLITWTLEPRWLIVNTFGALLEEVRRWSEGAARDRWLAELEAIASDAEAFAQSRQPRERRQLLERVAARAVRVGGSAPPDGGSRLYAAHNAIGEHCELAGEVVIAPAQADEIAQDAAPWFDFWRDSYRLAAARISQALGAIFRGAAPGSGRIPLSRFAALCKEANLPLRTGRKRIAAETFDEIRAALAAQLSGRPASAEWVLTAEDCHVLRRRYDLPDFDEFTWPMVDLMIDAPNGNVEESAAPWIISEIHAPLSLMQHVFTWCCPDLQAVGADIQRGTNGEPFSFARPDLIPRHVLPEFDALLGSDQIFVSPFRSDPGFRVVSPGQVDVVWDERRTDLRMKLGDRDAGSLCRGWLMTMGLHPFVPLRLHPVTPRLRMGRVVVQRRTWLLPASLFRAGRRSARADMLRAVEIRERHGLPRHVYVRPTTSATANTPSNRRRDVKPAYVDLESYPFIAHLHRLASRHEEIELTEMLPAPSSSLQLTTGERRTLEFRWHFGPPSS